MAVSAAGQARRIPFGSVPREAVSPLVEVAFLDRDGVIEWVNGAWDEFCRQNGGDPNRTGVGVSYLSVCDAAADDPGAVAVGRAIRTAISGEPASPVTVQITCDTATAARWFDVLIAPRDDIEGNLVGASVSLAVSRPPSARAPDFFRTEGRMHALIRANSIVTGDLNLQVALRHIAEAARELGGARYAALSVVTEDGHLDDFVQVGVDEATAREIGKPPWGRGVLGHLMRNPEPLRLADVRGHPSAVGVPPGHPTLTSFLGVPIRLRGSVLGILFLAGSHRGEFSAEDEELVTALATSAGVAIQNARLYEQSERRRQWQESSTETAHLLFSDVMDRRPVEIVLDHAMRTADGDVAELALIGEDDRVLVDAAVGRAAQEFGPPMHLDDSPAGTVLREGKPVFVEDASPADAGAARPEQWGSMLVVPIATASGVPGALSVARLAGRARFNRSELDHLTEFARNAGIALELRRARADHESLALVGEHDRIAADLHDHVIQELFSIGMGLQAMVHDLDRPDQQARVLRFVEDLDTTIRRIRTTIFQMDRRRTVAPSLQRDVFAIIDQEQAALGFSVQIDFSGPLDAIVPLGLHDDVCAVVREALSNVARHARAGVAGLRVQADPGLITIEVEDDGVGVAGMAPAIGLENLRQRAEAHGGQVRVGAPAGGGTRVTWTARTDQGSEAQPAAGFSTDAR